MLVKGSEHTHRAFAVGIRLECMRRRKPKRCGVRGQEANQRRNKRKKTFQKDHHRLHTDRHGLPSDRLCYSETREVGDEEGMEEECEKTERSTSGNILSKHTIKYAKYM